MHPILFFIRCYFDKTQDEFTAERATYYDSYSRKVEDDSSYESYEGHPERFTENVQKFQPWTEFVEDRDHYFSLPLQDWEPWKENIKLKLNLELKSFEKGYSHLGIVFSSVGVHWDLWDASTYPSQGWNLSTEGIVPEEACPQLFNFPYFEAYWISGPHSKGPNYEMDEGFQFSF